jgi:uncharacterized protein (TIGR02757 family)
VSVGVRAPARSREAARLVELGRLLDEIRARADLRARRAGDPVEAVHRQASREDRELVALLAASVAFGNVKAIRAKLDELLARIGPSPSRAADDPPALHARLATFRHRVYQGEDLGRLLVGARRLQREAGSLGAAFIGELARADAALGAGPLAMREALAAFCDRIRAHGGLPGSGSSASAEGARRGPRHLLPDPRAGSGAKRLFLFLRWMVRPADGVDLGLWDVPASRLLMPVDVHIHKLSRNLGFTRRKDVSFRTAVEITEALAAFDASDPTRYDFSLCHMGMVQRCPSRADPVRCEGCGVRPVCLHWRGKTSAAATPARRA